MPNSISKPGIKQPKANFDTTGKLVFCTLRW